MREIPLTHGHVTIVDSQDFDWLNQWTWYAHCNPKTGNYYAARGVYHSVDDSEVVFMHRQILGLERGDRRFADHRNHNALDNQRSNLRIATNSQNQANQGPKHNNPTGYKGVRQTPSGRWRAVIKAHGQNFHLGTFDTPELAAEAYNAAALHHFGEFAWLNTT